MYRRWRKKTVLLEWQTMRLCPAQRLPKVRPNVENPRLPSPYPVSPAMERREQILSSSSPALKNGHVMDCLTLLHMGRGSPRVNESARRRVRWVEHCSDDRRSKSKSSRESGGKMSNSSQA